MPSRSTRLAKPAFAILAILLVAGSLLGLRASQADREPAKKDEGPKTFEFAPGDLAQLTREPLGRRIPFSGTVQPILSATVRAKVPAEVARVHVQEGQPVREGQSLATLDTADLRARLDRESALVAEARARLDLARKNRANHQALLERAFISRNAFDSAQNGVEVAEANVKSAAAQAAIAGRALADAEVRAPFSGIIARRFVNLGDKVSADMPVAQIVDLARMEIEAQLPVSEIPFVKVGQPVAFRVDGFAGREFRGRIERINPAAEAGSRSIAAFVEVANADGALKGGMFASGSLDTASGTEVDVVPVAAVLEEGGQSFVHVVRNGRIERRAVSTGIRSLDRGLVEIREGLERGIPVVTVKAEGLKAGARAVVGAGRKG
jgi:membrane fusion protein, multidrug efflux system